MDSPLNFKDAALAMENRMAAFYAEVSERVRSENVRDALRHLADQEREHARQLEALTDLPVARKALNQAFQAAGEIMSFLTLEFLDRTDRTGEIDSEEAVLQLGIQAEKDAMLFYSELYRRVDDEELKDQVKRLIGFEERHLMDLRTLLRIVRGRK